MPQYPPIDAEWLEKVRNERYGTIQTDKAAWIGRKRRPVVGDEWRPSYDEDQPGSTYEASKNPSWWIEKAGETAQETMKLGAELTGVPAARRYLESVESKSPTAPIGAGADLMLSMPAAAPAKMGLKAVTKAIGAGGLDDIAKYLGVAVGMKSPIWKRPELVGLKRIGTPTKYVPEGAYSSLYREEGRPGHAMVEIPGTAKIRHSDKSFGPEELRDTPETIRERIRSVALQKLGTPKIPDIVDWPELYTAAPYMKDFTAGLNYGGGSSADAHAKLLRFDARAPLYESYGTIHHEIQHPIQSHEDWYRGAASEQFTDPGNAEQIDILRDHRWNLYRKLGKVRNPERKQLLKKEITDTENWLWEHRRNMENYRDSISAYAASAGEIQARDANRRAYMSAEEKAATPPFSSWSKDEHYDYDIRPEEANYSLLEEPATIVNYSSRGLHSHLKQLTWENLKEFSPEDINKIIGKLGHDVYTTSAQTMSRKISGIKQNTPYDYLLKETYGEIPYGTVGQMQRKLVGEPPARGKFSRQIENWYEDLMSPAKVERTRTVDKPFYLNYDESTLSSDPYEDYLMKQDIQYKDSDMAVGMQREFGVTDPRIVDYVTEKHGTREFQTVWAKADTEQKRKMIQDLIDVKKKELNE